MATLLNLLASGMTIEEIIDDHPDLERDDLLAALEFGALTSGSSATARLRSPRSTRSPMRSVLSIGCSCCWRAGLQLGELQGIRRRHVDLDRAAIRIVEQTLVLKHGTHLTAREWHDGLLSPAADESDVEGSPHAG